MITEETIARTHKCIGSAYILHKLCNANSGRNTTWYKPHEERQRLEMVLRAEHGKWDEVRFPGPVLLTITRVLGHREALYDADSLGRGTAKQLIDAMVACNWFVDDSPKYIQQVIFFQDPMARKESIGKAQSGIRIKVWEQSIDAD